ncbi:MAG: glutamate racemase [Chitinophagia bacterium]|nr:glutamate racemase [Chitinophagia bacterium]
MKTPIGIFDSGYGGLTVFAAIAELLPQYDYVYLGDNARAPYGNRSFETIHQYTLQAIKWLFDKGCPLVVLACNTASAKALSELQQQDLPCIAPENRVLGVIRPTAEIIGNYTSTGHIGILGTKGTIASGAYKVEIHKFFPDLQVHSQACPLWVPLIETNEYTQPGAQFFIDKYLEALLSQHSAIDVLLLACTHYPLLIPHIRQYTGNAIKVVAQGGIVAHSLADYLHRHPEMETRLTTNGTAQFYTTDDPTDFNTHATLFYGKPITAMGAHLS